MKKVSFPREILPLAAVGSMLVHFFLQSWCCSSCSRSCAGTSRGRTSRCSRSRCVALLLLTGALGILLSAVNVYLRDTQHFLELALLAWFWMTPIVYALHDSSQNHARVVRSKVCMLNPVTPIVLVFQRAIYARVDNTKLQPGRSDTTILPHWPYWGYVAYLGYSFAFGIVVLALAVWVFGRSEANFAEEL